MSQSDSYFSLLPSAARSSDVFPKVQSVPHQLQEKVELRVGIGIHSDLKEWLEDVVQKLLEILNDALSLVDVIQPRDLHEEVVTLSEPDLW